MPTTPEARPVDHGFHTLNTLSDVDTAVANSHTAPVLIFKHSPTCGISAQANEEVERLLEEGSVRLAVWVVGVIERRDVSNAVAARFGIRHESPQVLLLKDGVVAWHASHFHVNAAEIRAAWSRISALRTTA